MTHDMATPPFIGVSSCLLGETVRYDGGHKRNSHITDTLNRFFRFIPVCPEVGCGLPIPREAMRLEGDPGNPRLMTIQSRIDKTGQLLAYCRKKVGELERRGLCGFVFKKNSPSCGLFQVTVYNNDAPGTSSSGLFTATLVHRLPLLPVEEEERLNDPAIREEFIARVLDYHRRKYEQGGK